MKKLIFILTVILIVSCKNSSDTKVDNLEQKQSQFSIVIHGGAGTILRKNMSPEQETLYTAKLEEAIAKIL